MSSFAGLGLLKANLNKLARVPSSIASDAAKGIDRAIRKQARAGTDPYGTAHAPLKHPRRSGRTGPPLVDSGESYRLTTVTPLRYAGIGIKLGRWLAYHMRATDNRVARPALPRGAMPPAWRAAIDRAAKRKGLMLS